MAVHENRYWAPVAAEAENNAHAYSLGLIGFNKRVLELGPAAGHVTRAMVDRGCTVVGIEVDPQAAAGLDGVAECHVGDLNDPTLISKAAENGLFDVVLAGDVLEHLNRPLETLRAARNVVGPGGYIVISVPNIAHADVALALAQGRFAYNDYGLLDRTHISFFTLDSLYEMLEAAGLVAIDLERVIYPVFSTEIGVDATTINSEVLESILAHPEAETYQFVCRAVPHDGDLEVRRLASRAIDANERARRERSDRLVAEVEAVRLRAALADAEARAGQMYDEAFRSARHIEALMATRTMRAVRPFRAVYSALRRSAH